MSNIENIKAYYNTRESRVGYMLFLNGTKHFGFYEEGDKWYNVSFALRKMEHKIGDALNLPRGSTVLDAGCGMGIVSHNLARWYGYNITGIDILDFNLETAQAQAGRPENKELQLEYLEMDYHELAFADQTFDGAYTTETFVHAGNPKRVLKELHRVLKPRGRLVQLEYSHDPYATMSAADRSAFEFINTWAAMPAFNLFEHGVHEKILAEAGFTVTSSTNCMKNTEPMLWTFMMFAWLPVQIIRFFGQERRFVNAVAAVDLWRLRSKWRINIIVAEKS